MQNFRHLQLLFCFFGQVPPTLRFSHYRAVHSVTLCPVETNVRPIIKTQYQSKFTGNTKVNLCSYGGPGGIRTRVQNTFLFASYSNITHKVSKNRHPLNLLRTYSNHKLQLCISNNHAGQLLNLLAINSSTLTSSFTNNGAVGLLYFSPRCASFHRMINDHRRFLNYNRGWSC